MIRIFLAFLGICPFITYDAGVHRKWPWALALVLTDRVYDADTKDSSLNSLLRSELGAKYRLGSNLPRLVARLNVDQTAGTLITGKVRL